MQVMGARGTFQLRKKSCQERVLILHCGLHTSERIPKPDSNLGKDRDAKRKLQGEPSGVPKEGKNLVRMGKIFSLGC